ncbi:MAG: hypothetical protein LBU04_00830 [Christensenellaceae bacterium]|nr:hypothetical protein [Christensenellaceae bacterium]
MLEKSSGLSLSDQYWICAKNQEVRWADVNFFHNSFSEDVGHILFKEIDVADTALSLFSPDNTSDGVLKKSGK